MASSVKRVVFTSSCSAVRYREDTPDIFSLNESHWSDPDYCKRHHVRKPCFSVFSFLSLSSGENDVDFQLWYALAKTLAEREAWRVAAEHGVDLVVVNPSYVVGPILSPQPTSTLLLILSILKGLSLSLTYVCMHACMYVCIHV